jgi:hypothetical protein
MLRGIFPVNAVTGDDGSSVLPAATATEGGGYRIAPEH